MKQLALLLLLMMTPCLMVAQKKELSQARTYIKSGKYSEAEKLMKTLLKEPANRLNKRVYTTWYDAVKMRYEQGNEKLYLKQKYDTTAFFDDTRLMFTILEALDSIAPEYREKNAEQLNALRSNLFNGGVFHVRKGQWKTSFDFFETYIDCDRQPLFESYQYATKDSRMSTAGYWATYSGYKLKDPVLTLRHRLLALKDTAHAAYTLQFMAEARKWLKDDEFYLKTLEEGFKHYPTFSYFFPRLIDVYTENGWHEKALAAADAALAVNDSSTLYLFAKSSALLRLERYTECIQVSDRVIAIDPEMAEPYFNAGSCYVNMAEKMDNKQDRLLVKSAWQSALPYMEKYRELMPDAKDKWAPVLYRIYLNLNMGRKFDEIDHLLKK